MIWHKLLFQASLNYHKFGGCPCLLGFKFLECSLLKSNTCSKIDCIEFNLTENRIQRVSIPYATACNSSSPQIQLLTFGHIIWELICAAFSVGYLGALWIYDLHMVTHCLNRINIIESLLLLKKNATDYKCMHNIKASAILFTQAQGSAISLNYVLASEHSVESSHPILHCYNWTPHVKN